MYRTRKKWKPGEVGAESCASDDMVDLQFSRCTARAAKA
jgi:hypothetical protein